MTINEYNKRIKLLNFNKLAASSLKSNEGQILDNVKKSWDNSENPSGEVFTAQWAGASVKNMQYRADFGIKNKMYRYRKINISGETRRKMKMSNAGVVYSETDYWKDINKNFEQSGENPTDFKKASRAKDPKLTTSKILIQLIKNKLTNGK